MSSPYHGHNWTSARAGIHSSAGLVAAMAHGFHSSQQFYRLLPYSGWMVIDSAQPANGKQLGGAYVRARKAEKISIVHTFQKIVHFLFELRLPLVPYHEEELADQLSLRLFGRQEYRYSMTLAQPLNKQLYKQRNFDLRINLVDANGVQILNSNPIPISLCVYSADQQPKVILSSKSEQPIIKGNSESELFHGGADFRKIHIREVSSYFANGWMYLVIHPKAPSFNYNAKESTLEETVDYRLIKPMVISEVVVRAKKK